MRQVLGSVLVSLLVSTAVQAQVQRNVPRDFPTIQSAIIAAQTGDTIRVAPGTYVERINFLGKAITVVSVAGSDFTTIDGNQEGNVVRFISGEGPGSVLQGFTIRNGYLSSGTDGGGIEINGASPTIRGNRIVNNRACNGAGIAVFNGSPLIQQNVISDNTTFGCSATGGGGIFLRFQGSPQILDNVIANNFATNGGGGIAIDTGSTPLIRGNLITGNQTGSGGGIKMQASGVGAAKIIQNVIAGNKAGGRGGAIHWEVPNGQQGPSIVSNTLVDNEANQGVAIYADGSNATEVKNNIIVGKAGQTPIFCASFRGTVLPTFGFNNVFAEQAASYAGNCLNVTGVDGNISAAPLFVDRLVSNFRLLSGSPGIDGGSNSVLNLPTLDFDTIPRILGGTVDMGAFEFAAPTTSTVSPLSLTYADQAAGTMSAVQDITVTNTGSSTLVVSGVAVSGEFSQTNTCQTSSGIPAGQSCILSVRFTPVAGGARSGQLTISSNSGNSVITLSGTGVGALTFSANPLTFSDQRVGTTSPASILTLSNAGSIDLDISSIIKSGNDFTSSNDCPTSLAAASSCTISVQFVPTARGTRPGAITVTSSAADTPHVILLSGTGIAPVIVFSPPTLVFPSLPLGNSSAPQTVTLSNKGDLELSIGSIAASPGSYTATNDCPGSLGVNQTCTITVTFLPVQPNTISGNVTVVSDAIGNPNTVALSGVGTGAFPTSNPTSVVFPNQLIFTTSSVRGITLQNIGTIPLTITGIVASSEFSRSTTCGTLNPFSTCTILVTFTPTSAGLRQGTLTIASNAFGSPHSIPLSGTGILGGVSLSSTALLFPSDRVGTTSPPRVVSLTNFTGATLSISSISTTEAFSQTNNCEPTVAVGSSCSISVTFSPTTEGQHNGALTIVSDGPGSPHGVTLSGTGLASLPVPSVTGLNPNARAAGSSGFTLTVSGSGFSTLSVVRWNGSDRPTTFVDNVTLTAAIPASDLANAGAAPVSVFNPDPGGGISNSVDFTVYLTLTLTTKDLIYDPLGERIYASVPGAAASRPNTLTPIDPFAGALGTSTFVGSDPGKLAISDDSSVIYVSLDGTAQVRAFDTVSQAPGISFTLGSDPSRGPFFAEDIAVAPGNPGTIAISRMAPGSPKHEGVAIYDNGVKRPLETPDHTGSNAIEFSTTPATLYGYNNENTEFGFRTMSVGPSGVVVTNIQQNLISDFSADIQFEGGRVYATTGRVIDPVSGTILGTFPLPTGGELRGVAADSKLGRAFYLHATSTTVRILAFDVETFTQTGSLTLPGQGTPANLSSLVRWGDSGLAFRTATQVITFEVPRAWLPPVTPSITLAPAGGRQGQQNLNVAVTGHFTNFVQGQTTANFGAGITVNSLIIEDAKHATVNISIAPAAFAGLRDVTMTTGNQPPSPGAFMVDGPAGFVASWGLLTVPPTNHPLGVFRALAAGDTHSLAIQQDGTLVGWGSNVSGQINLPTGTFTAVAAGSAHSMAIRTDGTLVAWGDNSQGQTNAPSGTFKKIAAGAYFSLAIRTDGTLVGWGANDFGQINVPAGTFTAIAAGDSHSLAIRTDGTLIGWGNNSHGQTNVPAGAFTAIAAGELFSLGLRIDGTLAGWGDNSFGQIDVPSGTFSALAAGRSTGLGIGTDGTLTGWGLNTSGQTSVPAGRFSAIAARGLHGIALRLPPTAAHDLNGDERSDILWRHTSGTLAVWLMNGNHILQMGEFGVIANDWAIGPSGDFNGDGKSDVLWRHTDGTVVLWMMNGLTVAEVGGFGAVPNDWSILGASDFDGDGRSDILWRHADGTVVLWMLDGLTVTQVGGFGAIPNDWAIVRAADFSGDGKNDILWRHTDGTVVLWMLDGLAVTQVGGFGAIPNDWAIAGAGDFNGDGKGDILWRHTTDGTVVLWTLDGLSVTQVGGFGAIPNAWAIVGIGDFNGDSKSDILWRHTDGTVAAWLMNGTAVEAVGFDTIPTDWVIQSFR